MATSIARVLASSSRHTLRRYRLPSAPLTRFASSGSAPRPAPSLPSQPSTQYLNATHSEDQFQVPASVQKSISEAEKYLLGVYARPPFILARGQGCYVWDTQERKYLDFTAGIAVNALGHADPDFANCMHEVASTLSHSSNAFYNEWAGELAKLLVTLTQREGGLGYPVGSDAHSNIDGAKVFFSSSGTEANEGAFKIARKVGKDRWAMKTGKDYLDEACDKIKFVCFEGAFHGRTMGALSATTNPKYQAPFRPLIPGFEVGKLNDMESLQLITEETCGVVVEPIQGEGGINAAKEEFLRALRMRCDEVGAVLIFDEVQCGLYRTGTLWAHSAFPANCHPDIVTMAKPLANGYPIGAILMRDRIARSMTPGIHGTTFGGSPLACALGHHVLSRISQKAFVASISENAAYLQSRLALLPSWFPSVLQPGVRGRGLILGLGFKDASHPAQVVKLARERGVLLLTAGKDAVRLVPSLIIGKAEIDVAVDVFESCLGVLQKH